MKRKLIAKITLLLSSACVSVFLLSGCFESHIVSTETLLKEMIDKREISYFPKPYYSNKQFSSYDRATDLGGPNDYTWFANSDYSFFLGQDTINNRIEHVMYDADGPGCVTRIWMTGGGKGITDGIIRFYIDNSDEPVIEGKIMDVIGYNKEAGYPLSSALSQSAPKSKRGHNLYMPIPYGENCKITYESEFIDSLGTQMLFYNINYRTYETRTKVESFTENSFAENKALIDEVNKLLLTPNSLAKNIEIAKEVFATELKPKESKSKSIEVKNRAVSELTIKLDAEDMEQALRSTILKISFDNNETVWCPIGDFFGTGHIWRNSLTWSTDVDAESKTVSATWVMPFKKECIISFENLGNQNVKVDAQIAMCEYDWNRNSMYFGSSWYQLSSISTGENKERKGKGGMVDLNYVDLLGKGVYVGDALSVYNPVLAGHWKSWWGEGDEKIYVDGEEFPSHFGTGTEDYYGYSWCRGESFSHPFIAQPIGEGNLTAGYTINSRFRALDGIPFKKSLELDMELWHWVKTNIDYAPATFYYMLPGGTTNIEQDIEGAMATIPRHRLDVIQSITDENGLLEGEDLIIDDKAYSNINGLYSDLLSGGLCLQWNNARRGNILETKFDVAKEGEYEVIVGVVTRKDNAAVGLTLNGKKAVNSFNSGVGELAVKEVKLGRHKLKAEDNEFMINVNNSKNGRFAVDYIKIIEF